MAIPDLPVFRSFLSSLDLSPQNETKDYLHEIAIPESFAQDLLKEIHETECTIWFKRVGDFSLGSLIECLRRELEAAGQKTNPNVIRTLLCLYCLLPNRREAPVETLNTLLSRNVDADLTQFVVFRSPPPPNFQDFEFGSFSFGKLNSQRLSYRSKKAGSDYFERWQAHLEGRLAIERQPKRIRIFDWTSMLKQDGTSIFSTEASKGFWKRTLEAYFHFVSLIHSETFWEEFVEQQELQVAVGGPFIGVRELRLLPSSSASIYLSTETRWGFVAPYGSTFLSLDFGGADKLIPQTLRRLQNEFGFAQYDTGELHQTIKTFARFLSIAKRHLLDGRRAEAFLHFVIALDLLFGDKDGLTRNITKRVAVLTNRRLGKLFQDAVKTLAKIYDARSKYVHEGDTGGMSDIQTIQIVCEEVLYCLLRLQKIPEKNKPGIISEWRGNLDYFATALETGRSIPEAELSANGMAIR